MTYPDKEWRAFDNALADLVEAYDLPTPVVSAISGTVTQALIRRVEDYKKGVLV